MSDLLNARVLYRTWAQHFDPTAGPLERAPASVQEAWLLVAASAKILVLQPSPPPRVIPGMLYLATFPELSSWKGECPRRPTVVFSLSPDHLYGFQLHENETPVLHHISSKSAELREIPGLIYDETPLGE